MATWAEFEREAGDLAARVRARFEAAETHVLATLRRDGAPRVSGSEVAFAGADLALGSMPGARKARDLQRDGRFALHAHPSAEGDAKVAGVAVEVTGAAARALAGGPPGDSHVFRLDLDEAVLTAVEGNELVIRMWRSGEGVRTFRRR